jgi:hypothetical protein
MPDDPRHVDLRAPRLDRHDVNQADELVWISCADLSPRQRLGCPSQVLFDGIHTSIFPQCAGMASFLDAGREAIREPPEGTSASRQCG